ncbi:MAG TPA: UPF0147 family protein [Thermoplasmata archaeon]|nr:UPF0147 family protein [Thermoplasmata archaeon]
MSDEAPSSVAAPPAARDPSEASRLPAERLGAMLESLTELSEDLSVPKNIRRGALAAKSELERRATAVDVRIASAVYRLDELANDPNLPSHARTAIWSIVSRLESLP